MNALCTMTVILLLLTGCSDPFPRRTYFAEFKNEQSSLADGQISFVPSESWQRWDADNRSNIKAWGIQSPSGRCEGLTSENPITYSIVKEQNGYLVTMGEKTKITCHFGTEHSAQMVLYPVITPRPAFDPDEMVGEQEFEIYFQAKIR